MTHEDVEIDVGPQHLAGLDTIVDPLLVPDLVTVVWSPHGHPRRSTRCSTSPTSCCSTPSRSPTARALARVGELAARAYVVDLAWLRSTPWRERIAATFDPPQWRPALRQISGVTVRHRPDSTAAALLFVGWLASRLGWEPERSCTAHDGACEGGLRARRRGDVSVRLEADATQDVPGLAGVTIETARRARRSRSTAARAACPPSGARATGPRAALDGARRLARRGRDPRRGRAPGAAARPDLPARRSTPRGRCAGVSRRRATSA